MAADATSIDGHREAAVAGARCMPNVTVFPVRVESAYVQVFRWGGLLRDCL